MSVKNSRGLRLGLVVSVVVAVGAVSWGVNTARAAAKNDVARDVVGTYVDLIATGDEGDLDRLWSLSVVESPGALRTAGDVLVGAEERIEVVRVGEAAESEPLEAPYPARFDRFVRVSVDYRLGGEDHEGQVGLGLIAGEDGGEESDWRVVLPLMGVIAWDEPGFADVVTDAYVSDVRQVRRPLVLGGDEDTQPLYPAVYRTQTRLDPWFASATEPVTVVAGEASVPPDYRLDPTERTQERLAAELTRGFSRCGEDDIGLSCPVTEIVEDHGTNIFRPGWWLGFTSEPVIEVDHEGLTLTGAEFRFRTPGGVRTARVEGTCPYLIDNQSWTPVLNRWQCEIDGAVR